MLGLGLFRNKGESVCQEHLQIATNGVYPGFSTFNMALNGFGCSIEIIIPPFPVETTGGSPWYPQEDWYVTVRVKTKNGKTFEQSFKATEYGLRHMIKIRAFLVGIHKYVSDIQFKINNLTLRTKKIFIKAFKK